MIMFVIQYWVLDLVSHIFIWRLYKSCVDDDDLQLNFLCHFFFTVWMQRLSWMAGKKIHFLFLCYKKCDLSENGLLTIIIHHLW